jgi:type 1 glutamine amidotransferase
MVKKALVVWGGWNGHEPDKVAHIFGEVLSSNGFDVEISDTLDAFCDEAAMKALHLIVPIWTMGTIRPEQSRPVMKAVADGTGIAGCHGGLCDAFRSDVAWQFMTGGNWVSHPGGDGVEYTVNITDEAYPFLEGIEDFEVKTEHYYLHVDPAVKVLATTRFPSVRWVHSSNGEVDMPVVWKKYWGAGRVFYNSLGHHGDVFDQMEPLEIMKRGMLWAADGKDVAAEKGISAEDFKSDRKMF